MTATESDSTVFVSEGNLATAQRLHAEGLAALETGDLVVDLHDAPLLGGAVQQVLLSLHKEALARGRSLALAALSEKARSALTWTGLGAWAEGLELHKGQP